MHRVAISSTGILFRRTPSPTKNWLPLSMSLRSWKNNRHAADISAGLRQPIRPPASNSLKRPPASNAVT